MPDAPATLTLAALGDRFTRFADEARTYAGPLYEALETRITQTNEVGRCSSLLPALTAVHRLGDGRPLAFVDVGCSAGLHLRWDQYFYDYGTATAGDPASPVTIRCELRGPVTPPLPQRFPDCVFRLGIDLNPVDLSDPVERRWFEALIWPEHTARRVLAEAAIAVLLRDPPRLVKGDATRVLEAQLDDVPPDTLLVVYNSAALCQGGLADQNAVRSVLAACSSRRPVYWLYCENEEVLLRALDNGHMMERKLANKDGHGRWLEWL